MFRARDVLVTFLLDNGDQIAVVVPHVVYFTLRKCVVRINLVDGTELSSTESAEEIFNMLKKAVSAYYS